MQPQFVSVNNQIYLLDGNPYDPTQDQQELESLTHGIASMQANMTQQIAEMQSQLAIVQARLTAYQVTQATPASVTTATTITVVPPSTN